MDVQMSLNKIADTLQINLHYEDGKVSGQTTMLFCPLPSLEIPVTVRVLKLFANDSVGIVAHIVGDLYVVVSHYAKSGAVNVFMINGDRLMMDGVKATPELFISKSMSIKGVVDALRGALVKSFLWKDRKWSILKLPT